jgi:crotonobetainyl-CoA:carnitine CoA-transferase CaiB-like acyl-CoA transferase
MILDPRPGAGGGGLAGLRVVEFCGGVGAAWASKLFADLGANVVRVEDRDDDVRNRPHGIHRWLNANKRSMTDPGDLLTSADLLIHDRPGFSGADPVSGNPAGVVLALTPFGLDGPYSGYRAEELNLIHGSSWGFLSPAAATDPELPPLKAPGHHATIIVATEAATVALAAVDRARRTGRGDHIDFSCFAAAAKITEFAPAVVSFLDVDASRIGARTVSPWGIYRCADGLMQLICPEQPQWEALVNLMGNPEWALLDVLADGPGRSENADLIDLHLSEWMASQQVDDLYHTAQQARVAMTPVATMAQLEANPQLATRGFFVRDPDGEKFPGPGFKLDQPWWALRSAAPERGAHDGEGWLDDRAAQVAIADTGLPGRPLDGVRICDFTWIWAGPACTQILAHLGADVVKLESPEHLCMFRRLPFNPPDQPLGPDTAGAFQLYNTDKRSLGLDLNHPEAAAVVRRLVENSDVVIDNFGVGTMARLGFGADDLRAINPDIIVVSLSGYGQTGPTANYMAYGPAGGALAGLYAANGYENGPAAETGIAIGDPATGITAAWATMAALFARSTGSGSAKVDVSMVEAIAATMGELWMEYRAEGKSPVPAGNHDSAWTPHNCYPAEGDDQWVTIACTDTDSWTALADIIDPELVGDPRFATAELRRANEAVLDALIAAWTAGRDRWKTTRQLQAVGVAAFPSLSPRDLWNGDPQLNASGMLERPHHPRTGRRVLPGVPWKLRHSPNGLRLPPPMLGQHTEDILAELGFTHPDIDQLLSGGVVYL